MEYEYVIRASDGAVVSCRTERSDDHRDRRDGQETEHTAAESTDERQLAAPAQTQTAPTEPQTAPAESAPASQAASLDAEPQNGITQEDAKERALSDAGVANGDAVFTKDRQDHDDGRSVYEFDFYTDTAKYEYEIDAQTGEICKRSAEWFQTTADQTAPVSTGSYIGADQAKASALSHAGYAESEVVFSKAKLEKDDGRDVYEVEFYVGSMEYEYKIDAYTGSLLEYDAEQNN